MSELKKDIILMYHELVLERRNFSGSYEGNIYQAINIFGAGIELGNLKHLDELVDSSSYNAHQDLKVGASISLLCRVSETIDSALDSGEDPIDIVSDFHGGDIMLLNKGGAIEESSIDKALVEAFVDVKSFNCCLIDVFNLVVLRYFKTLVEDPVMLCPPEGSRGK